MTAASKHQPLQGVDRIRPAYAQVASQLRSIILRGEVKAGDRLPNEAQMAQTFGVSRTTIREALRVLSSQGLLTTERGVTGGTFVSEADPQHVSDLLEIGLSVLTGNEGLTIFELLEMREVLEAPAARMAAARRTDDDLALLEKLQRHDHPAEHAFEESFDAHRQFHLAVVQAAHNRLLMVIQKPLFNVIEGLASRVRSVDRVWREVPHDHAAIVDAIRDSDAERAGELMLAHLAHLRTAYAEEELASATDPARA